MTALAISAQLLSLVAAMSAPIEGKTDLDRLQGRWETRVGARKEIAVVFEIKGCTVSATIAPALGLKIKARGDVILNESTTPKSLDWVNFKTADGQMVPDLQAIYQLDGDRLTIRSGGFNDERPATFESGDGIWAAALVFDRR
jgi:uncharacterized protein (TIGR03067 family)